MKKNTVYSLIMLFFMSLNVMSCGKIRFKSVKGETKFSDTTQLNYSKEYDLDLSRQYEFEYNYDVSYSGTLYNLAVEPEEYITREIDEVKKADLESKLATKACLLGINEFKLPNAYTYQEEDYFYDYYVSGMTQSVTSYIDYLDSIFTDFEVETDSEGLRRYYKNVGLIKYCITFEFDRDDFYLTFTPEDKYWDIDIILDTSKQQILKNDIYLDEPYKIEVTLKSGNKAVAYYSDGCFYSGYEQNTVYSDVASFIYNKNDEGYYVFDVSNGKYNTDTTYKDFYTGSLGTFWALDRGALSPVIQYLALCDDKINERLILPAAELSKNVSFSSFEVAGFEMFNGHYCQVLEEPQTLFAETLYKLWIDTKTGYILKEQTRDNSRKSKFETQFEADIIYGDYVIEREETDDEGYVGIYVSGKANEGSPCNVSFVDSSNKVLKTQTVESRDAIAPPESPKKFAARFIGWDYDYSDIKESVIIKPIYEELNYCKVTYADDTGKVYKEDKVLKYNSSSYPNDPIRFGYTFKGWDKNVNVIYGDLLVTAIFDKLDQFTVKFLDYDGSLLKEDKVLEGNNADPPRNPKRKGYTFIGWSLDYNDVKKDLEVYAEYAPNNKNVSVGSVNYYYNQYVQILNEMDSPEKQLEYIFEQCNNLALATTLPNISESMLNEGKALTSIYPHANVLNNYGTLLVKAGYEQNSVAYFENAIEEDPTNEVYYVNLAQLVYKDELEKGNFNKTKSLCLQALAYNQSYGLAMQLLVTVYLKEDRPEDALSWLIESAYYIWNDVSIYQFEALYLAIDEEYEKALAAGEEENDDFNIKFTNPLKKYIDQLIEIACLNRGWGEGDTNDFTNPIGVTSEHLQHYWEYYDKMVEDTKANILKGYQGVDYTIVGYYEGSKDGYDSEGLALCDSKAYVMAKLIDQYYSEILEVYIHKADAYQRSFLDNFAQKRMEQAESEIQSQVPQLETEDDIFNYFKKYAGEGGATRLKKDAIHYFEIEKDALLDYAYDVAAKEQTIRNEAYEKLIRPVMKKYYYDMTYCISGMFNEELVNYFYAMLFDHLSEGTIWIYLQSSNIGFDLMIMEVFISIMANAVSTAYNPDLSAEEEKKKAEEAKKKSKSEADIKAGFKFGFGGFEVNVGYSLVTGDGEMGISTPLVSKSTVFEGKTGNRVTTTLFYGQSAATDSIFNTAADNVKGKVWDEVMPSLNDKIPSWGSLHPYSSDEKIGYGNQITYSRTGAILDNSSVMYSSKSVTGADFTVGSTQVYKYNTITSSYALDNIQMNTSFKNLYMNVDSGNMFN